MKYFIKGNLACEIDEDILKIFGYEFVLRKDSTLHISDLKKSDFEEVLPYNLEYDSHKRVSAMCEFVGYIFRDYDIAILNYREYAAIILKGVMKDLKKIRKKLISKKITEEEIKPFDEKVHSSFKNICTILKNRNDMEVLNTIKCYDIKNYHK